VLLVIYSFVHFVRLIILVTLVKLHLYLLPVEVLLASAQLLILNQGILVFAHLELSKIMLNVSSAPLHNVLNVQPSQPAKHAQLLSL